MNGRTPQALLPAALAWLLAASAFAAEPTVGAYLSGVRERVVGKLAEALGRGRQEDSVSGVVTLVADDRFYLQNGDDGLKVLHEGRRPAPGDLVTVYGSPTLEGGRIVFRAEQWSASGRTDVPAARPATMDELVDPTLRGGVNWLRVTVRGRAIGVTDGGFAISVDGVPVNVMIDRLPDFLTDCERTHPVVSVTGVAELMLDPSALLGRAGYVMGVKLVAGGERDVVLEPDLMYYVARRDRRTEQIVVAVVAVLASGLLLFVVVIVRQRRRLFRTRTIMAERKRMADDIHDTIEQHLVGAGMLLKLNRLKEAQDVLVRAKREIRDIVWGLKNDDMMRQTPAEMLRQLAHEENTKGIYRVDTRFEGLPAAMDAAAMRDLSLIVRESIGNAVKHGGAKKIAISSDALPGGGWMVRVANDGAPFDPATAPGAREGHFGLEGMRQRARRLGATVSFVPRGKGMALVLEKRT
ncbi:MAG: sensor histidine kinase [Kiritimatiellia bacterium]